jgi:predicted alpha/beta superfamily hydrolase
MKPFYYLFFVGLLFTNCGNSTQPTDPIPAHETFKLKSKAVGEERLINVWKPSEYETSTDSLIVLYMLDGGIKEDFPHLANTLAELIKAKKIPQVILVGIENTERRRDLTGPTSVEKDKEIAPVVGKSEQFRNFIHDELIPEVAQRYRTNGKRGIIGESVAGLFVTETFLLKPEVFDFYIAFDPSIWWNDKHLVKTAAAHLEKFPSDKKTFWFAGSKAEDISDNVRNLSKVLASQNLPNVKWNYSDEKKEKHHTIFRATKEKALVWTLNNLD